MAERGSIKDSPNNRRPLPLVPSLSIVSLVSSFVQPSHARTESFVSEYSAYPESRSTCRQGSAQINIAHSWAETRSTKRCVFDFSRFILALYAQIAIWEGFWRYIDSTNSPWPDSLGRDLILSFFGLFCVMLSDLLLSSVGMYGDLGIEKRIWLPLEETPCISKWCGRLARTSLAVVGQLCVFVGMYDGLDLHVGPPKDTFLVRDVVYAIAGTILGTCGPLFCDRARLSLRALIIAAPCLLVFQNMSCVGIWNLVTIWLLGTARIGDQINSNDMKWWVIYVVFGGGLNLTQLLERPDDQLESTKELCARLIIRIVACIGDAVHFVGAYTLIEVYTPNIGCQTAVEQMSIFGAGFCVLIGSGMLWTFLGYAQDPRRGHYFNNSISTTHSNFLLSQQILAAQQDLRDGSKAPSVLKTPPPSQVQSPHMTPSAAPQDVLLPSDWRQNGIPPLPRIESAEFTPASVHSTSVDHLHQLRTERLSSPDELVNTGTGADA